MRALFKCRISINRTEFAQDATGGIIENAVRVLDNVRAVGRRSNKFEGPLQGKQGVNDELIFWFQLPPTMDEDSFKEKDYILLDNKCYDIQSISIVRARTGRYGAEVRATRRA